ncbi:hypothetical protein MB02_10480 [Croceicoccus estronivorus]|nr:hypothetical protein MB02_10480 [Croceicoccus estronivorus]
MILVMSGGLWRLDNDLYDELITWRPEAPSDDIVIVAVDDESFSQLGTFPWPRRVHAQLLDELHKAGAKVILYDFLFVDAGQDDAALAKAMSATHPIIPLYIEVPGRNGKEVSVIEPLSIFRPQGVEVGQANLYTDKDGIVRSIHLLEGADGLLWPHVAALVACRAQGVACIQARRTQRDGLTRAAPFLIPFTDGKARFRRVPFSAVLEGSVPASFFRDRIVLVGMTSPSSGDTFATPLASVHQLTPGVEINANAIQALLSGNRIVPAPNWLQYAFALIPVWLLLGSFLIARPFLILCSAVVLCCVIGGTSVLLWGSGIWLSPVAALAGIGITYPLWVGRRFQVATSFMREELERFRRDAATREHAGFVGLDFADSDMDQLRWAIAQSRNFSGFLNDTLNGLPDSSLVIEPDGFIRMLNTQARALLGDVERRHFSVILLLLTGGQAVADETAIPGEQALPADITGTDGRVFDVRWSRIHDGAGQLVAWVLRLADVTEIRLTTRQREEALQLLTHDMRAPQISILTTLEQSAGEVGEEAARRIRGYAHRTLSLADGFVQLARAEASALNLEEVNFPDIVLDAVDNLWPQATAKHIDVDVRGCEQEQVVRCDRQLITRAVINLIDNAIKYSPPESTIACELVASPSKVVLSICDTGPGIAEDQIANLFDPFRRVEENAVQGAGLGLAFVRSVLRRHYGTITCKSTVGEGTCFEIVLPR